MPTLLSKAGNTVRRYYEERFCLTIHNFKGTLLINAAQLLIYFYWSLCLLVNKDTVQMMQSVDINIPDLLQFSFLTTEINSFYVSYIGIGLNFSLLIGLLLDGILFSQKSRIKQLLKNFHRRLQFYISFLYHIYNQILFIPLTYHAMQCLSGYYIPCLVFISSWIISISISLHNQNYSYQQNEYLANRSPFTWQFAQRFLEVISVIFLSFVHESIGLIIINCILGVYRLIKITFGRYINSQKSLFWTNYLCILHLSISLILFIAYVHNQQFSIITTSLLFIPLSYSISFILSRWDSNFESLRQSKGLYNPRKDFQIRMLLEQSQFEFEDYRSNPLSIFQEIISIDHILSCPLYPKCFCNSILKTQDTYKYDQFQDAIISGKLRQKFLYHFILDLFQEYCMNKKVTKHNGYKFDAHMSFINYLIDIKKSKVQVFCELVKLNSKPNLSIRERALLYETYVKAQFLFDTITQAKSQKYSSKIPTTDFQPKGQFYEISTGSSKKSFASVEQKDYLCGIKFDENLTQLEKQYMGALSVKEQLIKMLCNDFINLQEFRDKSIVYYTERESLLQSLKKLSKIHYNSQKLQFYMERYIQIMSFGQRKKDLFRNHKKNGKIDESNKFDDDYSDEIMPKIFQKVDQKIFDKDNCVIFITLIDKIGEIKRSQSKFEAIFGYSLKEAIGHNISIILPNQIAIFHNQLLEDFVNEQIQLEDNNQNRNQYSNSKPFLLAKNNEGWAIPVSLSFKTDNIGLEECGLSTHITKIKTESAYIMSTSQTFQIQMVSEVLYDRLFGRFMNHQNDLRKVYLNRIIPLIHYFEKKWIKDRNDKESNFHKDFVKTIAFFPRQDFKMSSMKTNTYSTTTNTLGMTTSKKKRVYLFEQLEFSQLENELKYYSIEQMDIYSIQMKFSYTSNKYFSYNILELASLRKIVDFQEIKECLSSFSSMMKTFLGVSYNHQREAQKLDQLTASLRPSLNEQGEENSKTPVTLKYKKPQLQLELVQSVSDQNQEDQQQQQQISEGNSNDEMKGKEQGVFLDLQKLHFEQKEDKEQGSQFLVSSRMEFGDHNNINSNTQLFELSQSTERDKQSKSKQFLDNLALQKENKNGSNPQIQHLQNISETNIHNHDIETNGQILHTLQNLQKTIQKEHNKSEELIQLQGSNYQLSQRDHLFNNSEYQQTLNTQALATTDRFYETVLKNSPQQTSEQGKIEKLLYHNQTSILDHQSSRSYSQQTSLNHLANNLNSKFNDISKYTSDNQMLHVKQIGVNKKIEDQSETTLTRKKLSDSYSRNTGTIKTMMSRMFDNQISNNPENRRSKRQQELAEQEKINIKHLNDELDDYEGEDILKRRQFHNLCQGSLSSTNEEYYDNYEKRKSNIVAASSIHTSKSHNYEQKRNLKAQLASKKKNLFMTVLTFFGFCSVSVVIALTLFQFFNIINQFSIAQSCFEFLPWPMSFRGSYVTTMQQDAILTMVKYKAFPGITDNNYYNQSLTMLTSAVKSMNSLFDQYETADFTRMSFFKYLIENNMNMMTSIDDGLSVNPENFNENEKDNRSVAIAYFAQALCGYFYQLITKISNTLYMQKIQLDNFPTFNTHLVELQTLIEQDASDIINSIQSQVLILLVLVIVLSILLISAIFPIYYFVQVQNESLLKLFATIQPDHLKAMLLPIQIAQSEDKSSKMRFIPENFKKKKTISNTSVLPKFKAIFVLYSIFSFVILIIQPITNFILIKQFRDETFLNIDLLCKYLNFFEILILLTSFIKIIVNLYSLKANFISSVAVFFQAMTYQMNIGSELYDIAYYTNRINSLVTQNQEQLNNMYNTLSISYSTSRYQQSYYDNFLYVIIQDNMCDAYNAYPQFITSENTIDQQTCQTVEKGILQKGFQFCVKSFLTTFVDLQQIIQDPNNYLKNILEWESQNKIQEFDKYFNILYKTINIMRDFMLQMMKDQLNMMQQVQTILLIFQLCALLFVFLVGWVKFYNYIIEEMYLIKNLISILTIEVVLENPYIISYLNK